MNKSTLILALSLSLAAAGTAAAQAVSSAADVTQRLASAGYTEVRDIEFDDGLWEAEVRHADGRWHDVAVDGSTGDVLDDRGNTPLITAAELMTRLQAAGYTDIRDTDLDDAVWEVDATSKAGQRVELRINAHSGKVISENLDD
ncbi:PepSY domain-containing protein [Arenimonas sp. MALMAid1274]|uniref:PepSY domain-containing protein n=1 Tax=Arenimonas sp. MALMAid1274 TaxID=3411630 RepID=UPI003BA0A6B5